MDADDLDDFVATRTVPTLVLLQESVKPPSLAKAISAHFRHRLVVAIVDVSKSKPAIIKELEIKRLPAYAVIDMESKSHLFLDKHRFKNLKYFLDPLASKTEIIQEHPDLQNFAKLKIVIIFNLFRLKLPSLQRGSAKKIVQCF